MENNNCKSGHLPWPLLVVVGFGGMIIASSLVSLVALVVQGHKPVYIVLAAIALFLAIAVSQSDMDVRNDVSLLLVAFPLFIVGFAFGYIAGANHMTLTFVLQLVAAVLSFALSKNHSSRQLLICYSLVLVPLIAFSYFDGFGSHHRAVPHITDLWCFGVALTYMGVFAATIKNDRFYLAVFSDYEKTVRFATAVIASVLISFVRHDSIVFAFFFAAISFAFACILLRKYVAGDKLIAGYSLALLCCASTAMYPSMALPFLGMLLSFWIFDYVCLAIFSIRFVCGVVMFYYDLDMLLIHKSYLLMASGALFLLMFYFIKRVTK